MTMNFFPASDPDNALQKGILIGMGLSKVFHHMGDGREEWDEEWRPSADAQIGMLLDELEANGLSDNTIVVLWGDHGWNLGEHGLWCKHCNFNTSLHAPLMISAPGMKGGKHCSSITEFIDIYPSLCELSGLPLPSHLEGESLVRRLRKPQRTEDDFAVCKFGSGVTLIQKDLFYTEWINNRDSVVARMLYDHSADPNENINISGENSLTTLVSSLSSGLRERRGAAFYK